MKTEHINVNGIPAILYGERADRIYLFLHGQMGCKEEAGDFAQIACPKGTQVLAVDLPGHGERRGVGEELVPWTAVPELEQIAAYMCARWQSIAVRANSIGAYFAMLAFQNPARALVVSPVLDMERLILDMMGWACVTEEQLQAEGKIVTSFGQTLSWEYLCWVREHPIHNWTCPVHILYGGRDNMTARSTVDAFVHHHNVDLTVMEAGEHWFHTPEQLTVLREWERKNC